MTILCSSEAPHEVSGIWPTTFFERSPGKNEKKLLDIWDEENIFYLFPENQPPNRTTRSLLPTINMCMLAKTRASLSIAWASAAPQNWGGGLAERQITVDYVIEAPPWLSHSAPRNLCPKRPPDCRKWHFPGRLIISVLWSHVLSGSLCCEKYFLRKAFFQHLGEWMFLMTTLRPPAAPRSQGF